MKMIMLQMNPQNWKQVLKGKKVMQINKRRPKEEPPYCILVCLKGKGVVGQFTCNEIIEMLDSEDVTAEPKKVYGLKISDPIEYANVPRTRCIRPQHRQDGSIIQGCTCRI